MGFNLFGSSSKTKKYQTTSNQTTENTKVDNSLSEVGDYGQIFKDIEGDVTTTDYGAVNGAFDLAERSVDAATSYVASSFEDATRTRDYAESINRDSLNFVSSSLDQVLTAAAGQGRAVREQADREAARNFELATQHSRSEGAEAFAGTLKVAKWGMLLGGGALILKTLMAGSK